MNNWILIFIGIFMSSLGAILLKIGSIILKDFNISIAYFVRFFTDPYIFFGFVFYFIPALLWVYLLSKYPISFLQPILALTYVITPILAIALLKESISILRWFGIFIIILGVYVVSRS